MTKQSQDQSSHEETETVQSIVSMLKPYSTSIREKVLSAVCQHLGIRAVLEDNRSIATPRSYLKPKFQKTIAELKREKQPKSATQMAAVVAYYLMEVALEDQRKQTITIDDIRTHFKKADFDLPKSVKDILPHAEDSGLFEYLSDGQYKLTGSGYDLVDKKLPVKKS
ncbi:MAG: hypothetical protein WCF84_08100 [Anaerolineae bacterium]